MKKLVAVVLCVIMIFAMTSQAYACVVETKPAIAGNHYVVPDSDKEQVDDGEIWHNAHSGIECDGCKKVNEIKEREYDNWLFGLWRWNFPSWWDFFGYGFD